MEIISKFDFERTVAKLESLGLKIPESLIQSGGATGFFAFAKLADFNLVDGKLNVELRKTIQEGIDDFALLQT